MALDCLAYVGVDLVSERLCIEDKNFVRRICLFWMEQEKLKCWGAFEGGFPEDVFSAMIWGFALRRMQFHESRNWLCGLLLTGKDV